MQFLDIMHRLSIEDHIVEKHLTHCTFGYFDLEWQAYFGYVNTATSYGKPDYHDQDYYELMIVLHTERKYFVRDTIFTAQYGDVIVFPPNTPHKGMDIRNAPYERYYLYFHPELFSHIPDGDQLEALFHYENRCLITFLPEERDRILNAFSFFKDSSHLSGLDRIALRTIILDFLVQLNRRANEIGDVRPITSTASPMLLTVLRYINTNFAAISTVNALAGQFGISRAYLTRLFRDELQTSPYQYLQNVRLTEARRLLEQGVSVTEACYKAGFNDCSHFIAYFKRAVGVTPGQYVQQL